MTNNICLKELRIILCDTYENYIGEIIRNERTRLGLGAADVYSGICSGAVYSKLERGERAGGVHVLRALCQRLGINQDRCGTYLAKAEYDELMDRLYILEDIRDGRFAEAKKRTVDYENMYKNVPLNRQFIMFMRGRLAELAGNAVKALEYYENAVYQTIPDYENRENIHCLTLYEAYLISGVARMRVRLGDKTQAHRLYMLLLKYCTESKVERWNLVCIYPKTVCELTALADIDSSEPAKIKELLAHCENALGMLIDTERLHYIRPLLKNIIRFNTILGSGDDDIRAYAGLLEVIERLFGEYGHGNELFEWYPYYVDCGFCCVNELIAERRCMRGMSIEELAGDAQSARNIQRIINGHVSPSYNTSKELLDRLGLKGVLRSDVIVGRDIQAYELFDRLLDYIAMEKYEEAEALLPDLRAMLCSGIEINDIVAEFLKIWLQILKGETEPSDGTDRLKRLLPFSINDIGKYRHVIKYERMIITTYIVYLEVMEKYEEIPDYDKMTVWVTGELSKKQFAGVIEMLDIRYANIYGDAGRYDESDRIAEDGIRLEMECERMYCLSTLLYCIAWNGGKRGKASQRDRELCHWAYEIAKFQKDSSGMDIYRRWLEK